MKKIYVLLLDSSSYIRERNTLSWVKIKNNDANFAFFTPNKTGNWENHELIIKLKFIIFICFNFWVAHDFHKHIRLNKWTRPDLYSESFTIKFSSTTEQYRLYAWITSKWMFNKIMKLPRKLFHAFYEIL